jgi:hypothetical protein
MPPSAGLKSKTAEHKKIHTAPSEMNKGIIHPVRMLEHQIVINKNEADGQGRR